MKLQKNNVIAVVEPNGVRQLSEYCKEHGLEHNSVFLTNSPVVLATRFLQRFKEDHNASSINYAKRLVSMMKEEQEWIHAHDYDLVFTRFDSSNENYVVDAVHAMLTWEK